MKPRAVLESIGGLLGDLEGAIMQEVWLRHEQGEDVVSVRQVLDALAAKNRKLAYTTVMTVMSRLSEKGILGRERQGKLHLYHATTSQTGFVQRAAAKRVQALVDEFGDLAMAQFVAEVTVLSPERREQLERMALENDA